MKLVEVKTSFQCHSPTRTVSRSPMKPIQARDDVTCVSQNLISVSQSNSDCVSVSNETNTSKGWCNLCQLKPHFSVTVQLGLCLSLQWHTYHLVMMRLVSQSSFFGYSSVQLFHTLPNDGICRLLLQDSGSSGVPAKTSPVCEANACKKKNSVVQHRNFLKTWS